MDIKAIREALEGTQLVCSKQCDQCLFSKKRIVSDERAKEILETCEKEQTHFICHNGSTAGKNVVCRGFFTHKTTPYLELMTAAGRIEFVDPATLAQEKATQSRGKRQGHGKKG